MLAVMVPGAPAGACPRRPQPAPQPVQVSCRATGVPFWLYSPASPGGPIMAIIAIAKKHALSHKKAKEAAQKVAEDLNKRFDLDYTWNGDCIDFTRPGLT